MFYIHLVYIDFKFLSSYSVGGSIPVIFAYFSEFFSRKYRNPFIVVLAAFWTVGRLYASLLAWIIIPRDMRFKLGSMEINSWRIFLMLCVIPSVSSAIILIFMPESPGYLFNVSNTHTASAACIHVLYFCLVKEACKFCIM